MRVIAVLIAVIGVFTLAFGIVLITQAASAEKTISDQLQTGLKPLQISEVQAAYDAATAQMVQMKQSELQQVSAGKPVSANYLNVVNQRTALGLSRSNIGMAQSTRMNGIIDIVVGVSLVLAGLILLSKRLNPATA
jgi:hypothetical protein